MKFYNEWNPAQTAEECKPRVLLTRKQVAGMLGVRPPTIRSWRENYGLPSCCVLRSKRRYYLRSAVRTWAKENGKKVFTIPKAAGVPASLPWGDSNIPGTGGEPALSH